jgi:hypothetical protein
LDLKLVDLTLRGECELRVCENMALRSIFGPNNIRMIKSKRMRWIGHVAGMEELDMHTKVGRKS